MNTGYFPEINVQLWQLRRTCSRLELRACEWCLMDALNRHCCQNQPSCSPLPPTAPSLLFGANIWNHSDKYPSTESRVAVG